ncbi:MAG: hypothetical protein HC896_11545 [Bacteroidales bacterium]|nr:hypothetical protein [Bacteroidales bacterium]
MMTCSTIKANTNDALGIEIYNMNGVMVQQQHNVFNNGSISVEHLQKVCTLLSSMRKTWFTFKESLRNSCKQIVFKSRASMFGCPAFFMPGLPLLATVGCFTNG